MIPLRPYNLKGTYLFILYVLYSSLIFLTPFIKGPIDIFYFTILFLLAFFILYISLLKILNLKEFSYAPSPIYLFSFLFLASILFSLTYSIKPSATMYGFLFMTSFTILGLIAAMFSSKGLFAGLLRILIIVSSFLCMMGLYQYFLTPKGVTARAQSVFITPNTFAGYLILILPLLAGLYFSVTDKKTRNALLFLNILFYAAILATGSRGGWIGLVAGSVFFYYLMRREGLLKWDKLSRKLLVSLILVTTFFFVPFDFNKGTHSRSEELLTPYTSESMLDRIRYWDSTRQIIKEHPIRGSGFWTFYTIYPKYKSHELKNSVQFFSHNDYLQFWSEIGIFGLLIFLLIVYHYFKEGVYVLKYKGLFYVEKGALIGSMAGSLSVLIHSLGDFNLYISAIVLIFWGYIGYALNLKYQANKRVFKLTFMDNKFFKLSFLTTVSILFFTLFLFIMRPFLGSYYNSLGTSFAKNGYNNKALNYFNKATALDPYESRYHSNLANAYTNFSVKKGNAQYLMKSEEEIKRAIKLESYSAKYYGNLANLYLKYPGTFQERDVFQLIKKIFEVNPTEPFNHYILYLTLKEKGLLNKAAVELKIYLSDTKNDIIAQTEYDDLLKLINKRRENFELKENG